MFLLLLLFTPIEDDAILFRYIRRFERICLFPHYVGHSVIILNYRITDLSTFKDWYLSLNDNQIRRVNELVGEGRVCIIPLFHLFLHFCLLLPPFSHFRRLHSISVSGHFLIFPIPVTKNSSNLSQQVATGFRAPSTSLLPPVFSSVIIFTRNLSWRYCTKLESHTCLSIISVVIHLIFRLP